MTDWLLLVGGILAVGWGLARWFAAHIEKRVDLELRRKLGR